MTTKCAVVLSTQLTSRRVTYNNIFIGYPVFYISIAKRKHRRVFDVVMVSHHTTGKERIGFPSCSILQTCGNILGQKIYVITAVRVLFFESEKLKAAKEETRVPPFILCYSQDTASLYCPIGHKAKRHFYLYY